MSDYGEELSDRELDVLRSIARGASNKEVAAELYISENTVKVHLRRVFAKLGVSSRTEATRVAIEQGLVIVSGLEPEPSPADDVPETHDELPLTISDSEAEGTPPLSEPSSQPFAISPKSTPQPRFPLWRTVSFVLIVLLVIAVIGVINLRLQADDPASLEPLVESPLGEDWVFINRPLPTALADMAVASVGLNVYVIGGETADNTVNTTYSFSTSDHLWRTLTPKPTAVASASAVELFGEIYVVGGRLANGQPTDIVEAYSPTQNAWRPVASLPQPISSALALSNGSFLYLFGGWNGAAHLDTTYVYDPAENSWRPLVAMNQPRSQATGQFMLGQLYVVGGFDGEQELDICEFFDPGLSRWFECPPLLLPRRAAASATVLNKLYVIGGENGRQSLPYSERYDPNAQTWQVLNTPFLDETTIWSGLGVTNIENRIFTFGGRHQNTPITDIYIYSPFVYRTFLPNVPVSGDQE